MRLALICQNFNARGGVSRDAFMFATALAERGVDVACYCDPRTSTSAAGVALHNVASLETKRPARIGAALAHASFAYHATRAIVRDRTRYDVVFVVGTNGFVQDVVRVHAVVKGETRRWPERGGHEFPRARIRARLAPVARPQNGVERLIQARQFAQSHSRRLVAVTDEVKEDVERLYGFPAERIDVVPCPIDYEAIRSAAGADARKQIGLRATAKVLLFLGNDFYRKGLDRAVRALTELDRDIHLVVVGEGPTVPFRRLASRLDVDDRTHFIGHAEQPERFLRDADVLVLPTREDVWGIALVEAMAAGLPIVTTAVAGASAVVAAAGAGVVLELVSTPAIAAAVRTVLADSSFRAAAEQPGVEAAREYDVSRLAPRLHSILESAAEVPLGVAA